MNEYEKHVAYLKALRTNYTSLTKIEWLYPDDTPAFSIETDAIQDGMININYQNGIRRTADFKLDNWDNLYDVNIDKTFFGQKLRIYKGLYLYDGTPYYLPQGVFYVNNPEEVYNPNERTTHFNLLDKWAYLDGSLFGKLEGIYQLNVDDDLFVAVRELLLLDRGNGIVLDSTSPKFSSYYSGKLVTVIGNSQVITLEVTMSPSSDGNVTVTFNDGTETTKVVEILDADTTSGVATKIASAFSDLSGWVVSSDNRDISFASNAFTEVSGVTVSLADTDSTGIGALTGIETTVGKSTVDVPITNCPYTSRKETGSSYADVLLEINTMLVGAIGYDALGKLIIESVQEDILDSRRPILWDFRDDEPELFGATYQTKMSDVYNDIVVYGAVLNGKQFKGRATNTDIRSDTCVRRIGKKTFIETNNKYYSDEQCQALADYYLKEKKKLHKSATFKCSPMYHFKENCLVSNLLRNKSNVPELFLVNGFSLPMGYSGEMTINAVNINELT